MKWLHAILLSALVAAAACYSDKPAIISFTAVPATIGPGGTATLKWQVIGATTLSIDNGVGKVRGSSIDVNPAVTTTYTLTAANSGGTTTAQAQVVVDPRVGGQVVGFSINAAPNSAVAGTPISLTITAVNGAGATVTDYRGTVHVSSDDPQSTLPADLVYAAADQGSKVISFTARTAGLVDVTASDVLAPSLAGSLRIAVSAGSVAQLKISGVGSNSIAGDALPVFVSALDAFGNAATAYRGTVSLTSDDPAATLPAAHAYTAVDAGVHAFAVAFATAGAHTLFASDGTLSDQTAVQVDAGPSASVALTGLPPNAVAGSSLPVQATVRDRFGNTAIGYRGTLQFVPSDASAVPPANYTFVAADNGTHAVAVTFVTAGDQSLSAHDTVSPSISGTSSNALIAPAAADHCQATGMPTAASAGDPLPFRITVYDPFGNVASTSSVTFTFTSGDARATLPPATTVGGGSDLGSHDFSARFGSLGLQVVTANGSGAISCGAFSTISAGPVAQFVFGPLPQAAIAGTPVTFSVQAEDSYGNPNTGYQGSPTLTSTDAGATFPAAGPFTNGSALLTVTFLTIGAQTVTATDSALNARGFGGPVAVHGLVYTAPSSANAAVALLRDASSTPALMVLQLVAIAPVTGYSVGFNIPADSTRAAVTRIAKGNSLDPGGAPAAMAAALPNSGALHDTLTSGLSQKSAGSGAIVTNTPVAAGQVLYTLQVVPTSTSPGTVFDGSLPGIRAAVRDNVGNELLSQADFALGRLELQ